MTNSDFLSTFTVAISSDRLRTYYSASSQSQFEAIGNYAWNIALCESLYPCLNGVEISLRNSLQRAAIQEFGGENWLLNRLYPNESEPLKRNLNKLGRKDREVGEADLVANSTLGFWLSLFRSKYEQILWPKLLEPVFPNCPRGERTRRKMYARLDRIRQLRHRAFHHEPIWHWQDLEQRHQEILETIGWISPAMLEMTRLLDRFPSVYTMGPQPYIDELDSIAQNWNS